MTDLDPKRDEIADRRRLKHPWDYGQEYPVIDPDDFGQTYVIRFAKGVGSRYVPVYRETTESKFARKGR